MKKKKRIKIIIIAVLVVAVAAGSITGVVYYRNSKGLASVMSVSMISTTNDYTSMTSGGMVCDDACQTINLKDGQKVTEVYVTKDQQVKAGDKLLAYDVTTPTTVNGYPCISTVLPSALSPENRLLSTLSSMSATLRAFA